MNVIVPNAETMEKSSTDTLDSNSMLCNALEQVKAKVRETETNINNGTESFFAALSKGACKDKTKRRETMHPEIDIRQYFQDTTIRDNILAIVFVLK